MDTVSAEASAEAEAAASEAAAMARLTQWTPRQVGNPRQTLKMLDSGRKQTLIPASRLPAARAAATAAAMAGADANAAAATASATACNYCQCSHYWR